MSIKNIIGVILVVIVGAINELHYEAIISKIGLEAFIVIVLFEVIILSCMILSPSEKEDC